MSRFEAFDIALILFFAIGLSSPPMGDGEREIREFCEFLELFWFVYIFVVSRNVGLSIPDVLLCFWPWNWICPSFEVGIKWPSIASGDTGNSFFLGELSSSLLASNDFRIACCRNDRIEPLLSTNYITVNSGYIYNINNPFNFEIVID